MEYNEAVSSYEEAATCFLKLRDDRALTWFMRAAAVCVENGKIERGIELLMRWGYKCAQELGDTNKADELWQKADELRSEYKLSHTCVITEFVESEFKGDVNKALQKAYHIYFQFEVKVKINGRNKSTHTSLCRYCIDAHQRLDSHILYLWNKQGERRINDVIEERKDKKDT
ncbi:hypothetical protein RF11_04351 [Thelohanellus kitauei]|uniref:Uncharacterized protein n=1 Tax=Thelohanellus kitauei TaxID=669202 RepID=A0A0C2MYX1_THEKT|nr:hypothetical protein RF11_04351 [Thelohanellus kitauei]